MMKRILKKTKKKKLLVAAHKMAKGLYDANIIGTTTMREFDELCLPEIEDLSPKTN